MPGASPENDVPAPTAAGRHRGRPARLVRPTLDPLQAWRATSWPYPFRPRPWAEVAEWYDELVAAGAPVEHLSAVVESVRERGADRVLGAHTSWHDLLVRPLPAPDPPYDVVAVRAPGSISTVVPGTVAIEHVSTTGHDERIERPVDEAVPLFWRFMLEKFGYRPPG